MEKRMQKMEETAILRTLPQCWNDTREKGIFNSGHLLSPLCSHFSFENPIAGGHGDWGINFALSDGQIFATNWSFG